MSVHLQEQFEIEQLLYRYAVAADQRDAQAYCACFKDGQVCLEGTYQLNDGHEVVRLLAQHYSWTMHNVHNHLYQIDGARATGFTYCVASHLEHAQQGQVHRVDMYIRYDDILQRTEQGWRFVSRHLQVGHQQRVLISA